MSECNHTWELWRQDGCRCVNCGETISDVITYLNDGEREIADLRAKLEQAEYDRDEYRAAYGPAADKAELERDEAQAQVAMMRGALEEAKPYLDMAAYYRKLLEMKVTWEDPVAAEVRDNIDKALSTTPAEAGERVQGLVELPPATKFLSDKYSICDQFTSIENEVKEACEAIFIEHNLEHGAEELTDVIGACITMLAKMGYDKQQRNEVRRQVIAKNAARGYYEEADT